MRRRKNLRENISCETLKEFLEYNPENGTFIRIKTNSKKIKSGEIAGTFSRNDCVTISVLGTNYLAHRLAWLYMTGEFPVFDIDHINGNPLDNRFINLREAKPSENQCNRGKQKNNSSGYKNVSWSKTMKKWEVRLRISGKSKVFGYFSNIEDAGKCAASERVKNYGLFAVDNRETILCLS